MKLFDNKNDVYNRVVVNWNKIYIKKLNIKIIITQFRLKK